MGEFDNDSEGFFDELQQRLFDALCARNAALGGTFRAAIREFKTAAVPGDERARVSLVGHAMREVMNALPSVMGENSQGREGASSSDLVKELPDLLARFPDLDLQQDLDYIPVPREVAAAFDRINRAAARETRSVRDDAGALLTEGTGSDDHPAIGQWIEARGFFVRCAHLERPPLQNDEVPGDEELLDRINAVQDLIDGRTKGFFDARRSLEELLAEINREVDAEGDST